MKKRVATEPYHPRQCHLCKYNGVNALLSERGLPLCEEATMACLACKEPGLPHDGISWVHLDAADNPATVYACRMAPDYTPNSKENLQKKIDGDDRECVLDILRRFSEIPFDSAGVVCGMLRGNTLVELAAKTRLSVQVLYAKWKRACKVDPIWRSIENGRMGKGVGRKPGSKTKTFDEEAKETAIVQTEMEFK